MQLPVDVKALIDEMTNINAARDTELSVSIYIDEQAPADLVAHVRGTFASTMPSVRMALSYLDSSFYPRPLDDIAIVVAGKSAVVGAAAAALRAVGVPTMVVTTEPTAVGRLAEEGGHAIPNGDLAFPEIEGAAEEPFVLDELTAAALDKRMGDWIVAACRDKQLAFGIAFPFMRRSLATDAVQATSLQNAGIGLVPLIPGADLPIMTLNQAKMVLQVAAAYGYEMDKDRLKELAAVVASAYVCRTLARELAEFVPVLGFIIRPGIAYGGTAALGYAIIEYFEGGKSVANVASAAKDVPSKATKLILSARKKATEYAPAVSDKIVEYAPKVTEAISKVIVLPQSATEK